MENNRHDNQGQGRQGSQNENERNNGSSWQDESQRAGSRDKSYDEGTGSSNQSQGMGSRGNDLNSTSGNSDNDRWGSEPGSSGSESMRMNSSGNSSNDSWDSSQRMSSSDDSEDSWNSGSGSQSMSGSNNDANDDWDGRSSSQSMSSRNESTDEWSSEEGHNMSSGSAYLEEEVDRASHQDLSSGGRNHDYMENNGNSTSDYNLTSDLNDDWDSTSHSQNLSGSTEDDWDSSSHSQEMRNDNDDFNSSGFEDESESKSFIDKRGEGSRTFNEDEESWKNEQRMSEGNPDDAGSGAGYGSHTSNRGTSNNNWDANDQTQRGRERHGDDEERDSLF